MCTQDSAGYPSRVHLIISRLETERGVGFEPRKRDTRPVAALKTIRELQNDLMQKINKYEPVYFGAYPTNNSVDIRSSSESESNSDSDCEQEARPATGKWAFSKCDIVSDLVVRVALDYLKSLGQHLRRRIPPVTLQNLAVVTVTASVSLPRMVTNLVIYPSCRLVFGTLYPAYASYKAVRTKNVKEYVKWMMYWIVFALFTCAETVTDVFFSWFPFYYEVKILLVLWLLSPATKGSSILYRKFVHPALCRREQEIDEYISKAKDQGYHTVLNLGTKGVNYATNVIMQTAIKGGGGLVQQIRRSYSLSDLSVSDEHSECRSQQEIDEADDVVLADPRLVRRSTGGHGRGRSPRPQSAPRMDMIFPEVDLVHSRSVNSRDSKLSHIRSSEDISSAYVPDAPNSQDLLRTASVGGATRTRSKVTRSTFTSIKRPGAAEDDDVIIEDVEEGEPSSILNYVLPVPQSDGTMCLPYSNDIISEYLRFVMNNEIQKRIENTNKVDNEYEQYLKLKEVYDSESKVSEKLKVATSIDRSIDNVVLLKEDNQSKIRVLEPEPVLITPPNDTGSNATPSKKENSSIISTSNLKEKVNLPNESDSKIVETSSHDDNTLRPDAHVNKNNKISEESRSIGASSSNLSSEDETGEGEFTTPNSSPVMKSKINKNIKHKKRHAPPPPISHSSSPSDRNESVDKLGAKTKEEQNVANVLLKASSTSNLENINDKDCVLSGVSVKRSESSVSHTPVKRKQRTKSKSSKGHKNESPLSKLMHLPSKFAFWNNAENSDQFSASDNNDGSNENIPCDGLNSNIKNLNTSIDNSTSSNSTKTTDPTVVTNSLESEEEQFLDATDTEPIKSDESPTVDMAHNNDEITIPVVAVEKEGYVNKVTSVKETDNFTYIPLKIETLIVNTESKSTDV